MEQKMNTLRNLLLMTTMAIAFAALTGCIASPAHHDRGYEGHSRGAPQQGYRQTFEGYEGRYDSNLGVYVLVDRPHHYYYNDRYYRHDQNRWYSSRHIDRGWKTYKGHKLPTQLANRYEKDHRNHDKDREKHRKRHRDHDRDHDPDH